MAYGKKRDPAIGFDTPLFELFPSFRENNAVMCSIQEPYGNIPFPDKGLDRPDIRPESPHGGPPDIKFSPYGWMADVIGGELINAAIDQLQGIHKTKKGKKPSGSSHGPPEYDIPGTCLRDQPVPSIYLQPIRRQQHQFFDFFRHFFK